ncbi:hypothetical protein [Acidiferrimicrobium sp. IK]|nr:hypothetical protein [Acidiferrimicrobium sp. IK]
MRAAALVAHGRPVEPAGDRLSVEVAPEAMTLDASARGTGQGW